MRKLELLSPAKDLITGITAVNNGADAVYIGAPHFGARRAAANSIEDVRKLAEYAHRFYCKVFVTLNTILYDHELAEAEKMIRELYRIGVDALIIQDPAVLRMDIPPISLHGSTQMHNYDLERIKFWDRQGLERIVLARELSLEQIREVRKEVKAELEFFIHGALCVSQSGQCYLSQHMFGRSANRGECAQPCRMKWSLKDGDDAVLLRDKYMLSLKDLNLSASIEELVDAGIDSFKIEGRLKAQEYVANVTNCYDSILNDLVVRRSDLIRSGSGKIVAGFTPDVERSFNRSFTDYFIHGRPAQLVNMDTPKSMGKKIATVKRNSGKNIWVEALEGIHNGDGLCYLERGELKGIRVSSVEGDRLECNEKINIAAGTVLFRNYDHRFTSFLKKSASARKIEVEFQFKVEESGVLLSVKDEDGNCAEVRYEESFPVAEKESQQERIITQLKKCGDTDFICRGVEYDGTVLFIAAARVNGMRDAVLKVLTEVREAARVRAEHLQSNDESVYPLVADWRCNIVNSEARSFYKRHGMEDIPDGFEINSRIDGKVLMQTKYCLLHELGRCLKKGEEGRRVKLPLYLFNGKHCFRLDFDCKRCMMSVNSLE